MLQLSRPTLLGLVAILLWGLLALFTTATAGIPPFQVTAITFGIGGGIGGCAPPAQFSGGEEGDDEGGAAGGLLRGGSGAPAAAAPSPAAKPSLFFR